MWKPPNTENFGIMRTLFFSWFVCYLHGIPIFLKALSMRGWSYFQYIPSSAKKASPVFLYTTLWCACVDGDQAQHRGSILRQHIDFRPSRANRTALHLRQDAR